MQCIHTGATDKSNIFLYWVPAQYTSAIKGTIMAYGGGRPA